MLWLSSICSQVCKMSKRERELGAGQEVFIDVPLHKESLFKNARSIDASVAKQQMRHTGVHRSRSRHVSTVSSNFNGRFQPTDASVAAESQHLSSRRTQSRKLYFTKMIDKHVPCPPVKRVRASVARVFARP
jgi:hypothetical protein